MIIKLKRKNCGKVYYFTKETEMYERKKDGLYYDRQTGRTWEHRRYSTHIYWSRQMLGDLKRYYANTLNDDLSAMLGVSVRTLRRKACELGLEKDPEWLRRIYRDHQKLAHAISRQKGYPGSWKKGQRNNPPGEFKKGRQPTAEERQARSESMKRWYRLHPDEARAKALKAWKTRRLTV